MLASVFSCLLPLEKHPAPESFLVHVQHVDRKSLSDCYDSSQQGVLVLACSPRASLHQPVPVYCNSALADAVGIEAASKERTADKVLGALSAIDPELVRDITYHARQVAASKAGGRVSLYLPAKNYNSPGGNAGSASDCQVASPRQRSVFGRQWPYAVSEPAAYTPDFDAEAPTSTNRWPARMKPRGVSNRGTWSAGPTEASHDSRSVATCDLPAVIVTFHTLESAGSGLHPPSHGAQPNKACVDSRVKAEARSVTTASGASGAMANREGTSAAAAFSNGGGGGRGAGAGSLPGDDGRGDPMVTIMLTLNDHEEPSTANMFESTERQIGGAKATCGAPSREGMALSGLASVVTAFTVDSKEVIYQNTESIACYGPRPVRLAGGGANSGPSILEKLFSLEPAKLERLLDDVRTEGKVWKGIVQVPWPLNQCPPAKRGEGWAHPAAGAEVDASEGPQSTEVTAALRSGSRPATVACACSTAHTQLSQTSAGFSAGEAVGSAGGADGAEASVLQTADSALSTSYGGRPRFEDQSSKISDIAEPLATSTWGLMLDVSNPKSHNVTSTASQRAAALQGGSSNTGMARSLGPTRTNSRTITAAEHADVAFTPAAPPSAMDAPSPSSSVRGSPRVPAAEPAPPAPGAPSDASLRQRTLRSASMWHRRSDVLHLTLDEDRASFVADASPGGERGASTAGLQMAASMSSRPGGRAARALPRRCVSRIDLPAGSFSSPRAPGPRVVAFAGSVRGAPTSVLLGLQAAASGHGDGSRSGNSSAFRCRQRPMPASVGDTANGRNVLEKGRAAAAAGCTAPPPRKIASATRRASAVPPEAMPGPSAKSWTAGGFAAAFRQQLLGEAGEGSPVGLPPTRAGDWVAGEQRITSGAAEGDGMMVLVEELASPAPVAKATATAGPGPAGPPPGSSLLLVTPQQEQGQEGSESEGSCFGPCLGYNWHEMCATRQVDPVTGQFAMVLTQTDVTAKVEAERHIALVTEVQHRLLEQMFPRHVLAYMTEEGGPWNVPHQCPAGGDGRQRPMVRDINKLATSHEEVTLLFADIEGFTPMCKALEPRVVMAFLNDLFTRFDKRLDEFGVYKVETIGDCYFVAGGLMQEDDTGTPIVRARQSHADPLHAERVFKFAKAMLAAASQVTLPTTGGPVRMRIGIHSGPVVSGVVGQRMPRFCLFGDTVNTTSRMESTGVAGCIHASDAAHALLAKEAWLPTGGIEVKGKGRMNTYLWASPNADSRALLAHHMASAATGRKTTHGSGAAASAAAGGGCGRCSDVAGKMHVSLRPQPAPTGRQAEAAGSSGGCSGAQQCEGQGVDGGCGGRVDLPHVLRSRQRSMFVAHLADSRADFTSGSDVVAASSSSNAHAQVGALSRPSYDVAELTDSVSALAAVLISRDNCK